MKTTTATVLATLAAAQGASALDAAALEYPSGTGVHKVLITDWFEAEGLQRFRVTCTRAPVEGGGEHAVCDAWAETNDGRRVEVENVDVGQLWVVPDAVLPNFAPLRRQIGGVVDHLVEKAR